MQHILCKEKIPDNPQFFFFFFFFFLGEWEWSTQKIAFTKIPTRGKKVSLHHGNVCSSPTKDLNFSSQLLNRATLQISQIKIHVCKGHKNSSVLDYRIHPAAVLQESTVHKTQIRFSNYTIDVSPHFNQHIIYIFCLE
jgi:hypothetical protein